MKVLICVVAITLAAAGVAYAAASPPPIVAQPLAAGTILPQAQFAKSFRIDAAKPSDIIVVRVTVKPGGNFGWHVHTAAVAVAVISGTLTLYDSSEAKCEAIPVSAGRGFVEAANHVHLARNEGTKPAHLIVTYLGAPHGKPTDVKAAQPAQCASVQ